MPVANRKLLRAINRFKVLHSIREQKLLSRVDIAKMTGLSQASVTGITAELIDDGLLFEKKEGKSIGGRKPILLAINPEGAYTIGVFLSIHQINVVVVNMKAEILASLTKPIETSEISPENISEEIIQAIQKCIWESGLSKNQISGVGISLPGLVDSETGVIRFLPNYQWREVNLRDLIYQKLEIPTYVENSANTLTIAEQWFGNGKGISNFITVNLEHGIGAGIVINGQIFRGDRGIAGEFGHVIINEDGPTCRCGQKGCLEAYSGNYAIIRDAEMAAKEKKWSPNSNAKLTIEEIVAKANAGEKCLQDIFEKAGHMLGVGLINLIKIFNPACIIISGKGVNAGDLVLKPMLSVIEQYQLKQIDSHTRFIIQKWDPYDNARGAGALVLQEVYKSPTNRIVPII